MRVVRLVEHSTSAVPKPRGWTRLRIERGSSSSFIIALFCEPLGQADLVHEAFQQFLACLQCLADQEALLFSFSMGTLPALSISLPIVARIQPPALYLDAFGLSSRKHVFVTSVCKGRPH